MELQSKTVVITGGTSGFGLALAIAFKNSGANVVVCSRNGDGLKNVFEEGILALRADVTKESDLIGLTQAVLEKFGQLDVWVNNAGIWLPHAPIEEIDWNRVHELMEVNFFGTVYGSKTALIQMRQQGFGAIINIISTSGLEGRKNGSAYCASKFAADGFTKSLRKEVEGTNIKVLGVYPGGMKTNLFTEAVPENYNDYMGPNDVAEKVIDNLKNESPLEELIIRRDS